MKFQRPSCFLLATVFSVACGSSEDFQSHHGSKTTSLPSQQRIVLAYEVPRSHSETLRSISQRFHVSQALLDKFNPREGQGRRKNIIYIPVQALNGESSTQNSKAPKIVKLTHDAFLRPVKLGDWSSAEEQNFQSLEEWFVPEDEQRLSVPVEGYISSGFSWRWNRFHKGIDLAARAGTPIFAAQDGVVTFQGWKRGFGILVIIKHSIGQTYYAHCQVSKVKVGQKVVQGDMIARVGNTGHSLSPHLHFEYRDDQGQPVDPTPFLLPSCSNNLVLSAQRIPGLLAQGLSAKGLRCD